MTNEMVFEYVGSGEYRTGLPKRDLYESDMARAAKQGWPEERIAELEMYEPVEPEAEPEPEAVPEVELEPAFEPDEIDEEEEDGDTVL